MPPQTPPAPVSSPSPNPQYDFILRDPAKPKRSFGLPNAPKPVMIFVAAVGGLFIIIILVTVLRGGKSGNGAQLIAVAGRAQEIARISTLVQQQSKVPNTVYLAATTQAALSSEQYQMTSYLGKHGVKVGAAQLSLYKNSSVDDQLKAAAQNNALESTYYSYLKTNLATYQTTLQTAAQGASAASLAILNDANDSAKVLLAAPEITSLH